MGNCQAIDAATLVIQHPSGVVENLYWPISASEVMKMNPGHYVALLLSTTLYTSNNNGGGVPSKSSNTNNGPLRVTRIKLLRPTDTLALGHCYRLVSAQEVMKGFRAKKQAKLQQNPSESAGKPERVKEKSGYAEGRRSRTEKDSQVSRNERLQPRTATSANSAITRPRTWQPSLKSISEASSTRS